MDLKINKIENENLEYCLFCYQEKDLIKNELCQCEFFYDQKCYEKWFINKRHFKCIICQRKIDFKFVYFKNEHNEYLQNLQNSQNNNVNLLIRNRNRNRNINGVGARNNMTFLSILDLYFEYIFRVIIILFIFIIIISLIIVLLTLYIF